MIEFLVYLLKVSAAIGLVTIPYYIALRKDANLLVKRLYLAGGILLSWTFPLVSIRKPAFISTAEPVFYIDPSVTAPAPEAVYTSPATTFDPLWIIGILYLAGILIFTILNLVSMRTIRRNAIPGKTRNGKILSTRSDKVFTVFQKIFLPERYTAAEDIDTILIHERAHIRQLHFIDLVISELSLALTWFNPFSWLISRMIKENHEHLADREVLSRGVKPAHYKALLLNHALGGELFRLGHQFNHSLTKNRFNMMKKMKATKRGALKYIVFVPTILFFTLMLTAAGLKQQVIQGSVFLESTDIPATGASVVIEGSTVGTVVDRQGEFTLDVSGNPNVMISFVGYETKRISAAKLDKKPVILIPKAFTIPLDNPDYGKADEAAAAGYAAKSSSSTSNSDPVVVGYADKGGVSRRPGSVVIRGQNKVEIQKEGDESSINAENWNIEIRGTQGTEYKEPVFIVDGKEVVDIQELDTESIERIEVYKNAANPELQKYDKGNGIVKITTKGGTWSAEKAATNAAAAGKSGKSGSAGQAGSAHKADAAQEPAEVFFVVEDMPSYPGGIPALRKYISENLEYPAAASKKNMAGKVVVQFTVKTNGALADIEATQSSNKIFESAAISVFKDMPAWNPGKQRGKAVSCKVAVPVVFEPATEQ